MKKLTQIICAVLVGVLCLAALFACKPQNQTDLGDLDIKFDDNGDPLFNNVNLKIWSVVGAPDNKYLEKVNTMFNNYYANNGVSAKISTMNESEFYKSLPSVIRSDPDNAPDMILIHSERLTYFASSNIIVSMDDYLNAAKANFNRDDYLANVMSECIYQDKTYGIPLDEHAGVWFYRSDVLAKNGIEVPHTLDKLVEACNKLVDLNNRGRLWFRTMSGNSNEWRMGTVENFYPLSMEYANGIVNGWVPETALLQNGGSMTDAQGRPNWNNDALATVMQMFRDMWQGYDSYPQTVTYGNKTVTYNGKFIEADATESTMWKRLGDCNTVFACEGPWQIEDKLNEFEHVFNGKLDQDGNAYQPLDIINMSGLFALDPTSENASKVYGVGHAFCLTSTVAKNPERAVAAAFYAKYMTENAIDYTQGGHLPANKKLLTGEQFTTKDYYTRYVQKICDPDTLVFLGNTRYFSEVYEGLKRAFADNLSTQATFRTLTAKEILDARFKEAIRNIENIDDL